MDRPQRLIAAFQAFDAGNTGRVSTDAVVTILTTLGNPLTPEEVKEFTADADDDGTIDYRRYVNSVVFGTS